MAEFRPGGGAGRLIEEAVQELRKKGVRSYCIIVLDPDSDDVGSEYCGNEAEIHLQCTMVASRIMQKRNGGWTPMPDA